MLAVASAQLSELKKNIKKTVKIRNDRLFINFLDGDEREAEDWKASYLTNPLLRSVARLIVWSQDGSAFILGKNGVIDSDGNSYTITDEPICVAHPVEMKEQDIQNWQKYFCENNLKQPFEQIWEPSYKNVNISPDRYEGAVVSIFQMTNKQKHGIYFFDEEFHNYIGFNLQASCDLDYWLINHGRHCLEGDFKFGKFTVSSMTRDTNHIIYILDKMTFVPRLLKDDISIMNMLDGYTASQITEFINVANENGCINCLAALLKYKNNHFTFASNFDAFILD